MADAIQGASDLSEAGLGLDYGTVELCRTTEQWLDAGSQLRDRVTASLDGLAVGVEHVGSSSVLGLLAKPIIDLAVGLSSNQDFAAVKAVLEQSGWIYRGDAGEDGGHVFVLDARPWHRVAHLHVVKHRGVQWQNYVNFRDLLRRSPAARNQYEATKLRLANAHKDDRKSYTSGKSRVVGSLLTTLDETGSRAGEGGFEAVS